MEIEVFARKGRTYQLQVTTDWLHWEDWANPSSARINRFGSSTLRAPVASALSGRSFDGNLRSAWLVKQSRLTEIRTPRPTRIPTAQSRLWGTFLAVRTDLWVWALLRVPDA